MTRRHVAAVLALLCCVLGGLLVERPGTAV